MQADKTFQFEQKRNIPTRYNRNLMIATVQTMQRVKELKSNRNLRNWEDRMM